MMRTRKRSPGYPQSHQRQDSFAESGVANGSPHFAGPLLSSYTADKKSTLRRAVNRFRLRLRQLISRGRRKSVVGAAGFVAACVIMIWCGSQIPRYFRHDFDGADNSSSQRVFVSAGGVDGVGRAAAARGRKLSSFDGSSSSGGPALTYDGEVGPRLAYGIMVYQRKGYTPQMTLQQFARMFEAMYDEQNTYVIHTDIKSDPELRAAVSNIVKEKPNAYEVSSVSVSWAGITVVERTLALMQKAVEVDDTWRWFVNIGHEDYPSASQTEMRRWMSDQKDGTNFIKCWPIEWHDFFGQMEKHTARVVDVNVDDFMGQVKEYRSLSGRSGSMERPKTDYKFYKSLQQTMLSRQLSEYAVYSSEARRLLLYMATAKAPDELYFPTLTQLDETYASMATCNDTRHFSYWVRPGGSWHPEYLTLDHLPIILNATEFYIRKVEDGRGSGPLLYVLDKLRGGDSLESTLPILKNWLNRKGEDGKSLATEGGPIIEFTDGTVDEALQELDRRQAEEAEARRAKFLMNIGRKRRKYMASQTQGKKKTTDKLPFMTARAGAGIDAGAAASATATVKDATSAGVVAPDASGAVGVVSHDVGRDSVGSSDVGKVTGSSAATVPRGDSAEDGEAAAAAFSGGVTASL